MGGHFWAIGSSYVSSLFQVTSDIPLYVGLILGYQVLALWEASFGLQMLALSMGNHLWATSASLVGAHFWAIWGTNFGLPCASLFYGCVYQ